MRNRNILLLSILFFLALSFYEPFFRIMIRVLTEGKDFTWDYAGIGGTGLTASFSVIILVTVVGLLLLFIGYRGANRFFRWSVTIWATLLLLSSLAIVISDPFILIIADTIGLQIPYAFTILPFDILFFIIVLIWLIKYRNVDYKKDMLQWNRRNSIFLVTALALVPVEYILFNIGQQDGFFDQIGVLLTFIQFILLNLSFYRWDLKRLDAMKMEYAKKVN